MNKQLYLGVDLGTSSIKLSLADQKGIIIDSAKEKYPLYVSNENWTEQNPDDWYNAYVACLKELGKRNDLSNIKSLSYSGQMHGLVILDENDKVIRNALLWNDVRTTNQTKEINDYFGKEKLVFLTGNIAIDGFTAPKLLWVKENEPDNFKKIKKIMLPKDYLAYKTTNVFASDVSDLSGTLLFDVRNKKYSKEMLEYIGISEDVLPNIYESYDVIGKPTQDFSNLTGLNKDALVVIGGGDQAMGAIGTGTLEDNQVSISLGTSGVVFASTKNFILDNEARMHSFCHANQKYHVMGVMLSAAGALDWFVTKILEENDFTTLLNNIDIYHKDSLVFLPYLSGERSPINDPFAKSVIYGASLETNKSTMLKAIIEGICLGLKDCYKTLEDLNIKPSCARVVGGAAQSSKVVQILSNVLGIDVKTINTNEGGTLGAIILSINADTNEGITNICNRIIKDSKIYKPNIEMVEYYNKKYDLYKNIYKSLK